MVTNIRGIHRKEARVDALDFHTHPEFEIYLFHGGNCRFLVGNQMYHLNPGDILMMDGLTVHRAYVFGDEEAYQRSVVHFDAEWIRPLLVDLQIDDLLKLFTENRNGLIRTFEPEEQIKFENLVWKIEQMADLDASYKNEAKRKLALAQLLLTIDSATLKVMDKQQSFPDDKTKLAEGASEYIFKHYRDSFTIEDVATALAISKSYLSHVFKDITGFTVMHYAMGFRLAQARNALLTDHSKSVKEIAREHGFESDAHFSRYFKQNVGITPSQYRKNKYDNQLERV